MKFQVGYVGFIWLMAFQPGTDAQTLVDKLLRILTGVESFISTTFVSNCQDLKGFFGINYDQFVANNKTPNLGKVDVYLRANNNTYKFNFTTAASELLASPYFNKSLPIAYYIHGILSNTQSPNVVEMVTALDDRGGKNVLYIDASPLTYLFYMFATTCAEFIGYSLGDQLAQLSTSGGISAQNIHLMGFSLGAHMAGFAGKRFSNLTGQRIGRISAMDAAGPCYFNAGVEDRLSPGDANFVDVIHTDAGVMGIIKPIGHVDFYVNGGNTQPQSAFLFQSHLRSWQFYKETIIKGNEKNFAAVRCTDWPSFKAGKCNSNLKTYMGYATFTNVSGTFYLRTADTGTYPFGLKEEGAKPVPDPFWAFVAWVLSIFGIYI